MPALTRWTSARAVLLAAALMLAAGSARAQAGDEPDVQPALATRDLPRLTNRVYPPELRSHSVPGVVEVRFKILTDGTVDSTSVEIENSSNAAFNVPAARVAQQLRFTPAMKDGEPREVWVVFPIHFGRVSDGTSTVTEKDNRMFPYHPPRS